jgi:hypothetical protein
MEMYELLNGSPVCPADGGGVDVSRRSNHVPVQM